MDAETLLTTTRSVRRKLDLDRPVEPEVITDCLRVAMQAPIASALMPLLRWVVVRDPGLRAEIAHLAREAGRASQAKYGHLAPPKSLASGSHLLDVLDRVPVFVIPCLRGRPEGGNAYLSAFYGSVYPALWSFQLALHARGLGSSIAAYHLAEHERETGKLLGIPDDVTQVSMLAVAYTTQATFSPAERPAVEDITSVDGWGGDARGR
jgi:nitroreductase